MGISGLLPLLKSIHKPCDLKKYAGQTIGVDAYGWLHRGTVACATELALGKPTRKFVDFAMHRVRMLKHFDVTPYLVFDGDYLPSKASTEHERDERRAAHKKTGLQLHQMGKTSQAFQELQKAVDVTPEMARQLIDALKAEEIQYVVAPYEADAQLVYLEKIGSISGIISEDSDLLVFGAKCLITKLDQFGSCVVINRGDLTACREVSFAGWSDREFRQMAILSGCDYLQSVSKMGLKTAHRLLRKYKTIERVIRAIQFDGQHKIPQGYHESFVQAERTFLYQRVFCPVLREVVMCNELEDGLDENDLTYIGNHTEPKIARGVACGDLHPMTKKPIAVSQNSKHGTTSILSRSQHRISRSSLSEAENRKPGKPIDTFFKARRTPLAELDPNSFTPSPTQQRVLRQNINALWSSSPLTGRERDSTDRQPLSRTAGTNRPSAGYAAGRMSLSATRPSKRPRLCSEIDRATEGQNVQISTSPFFEHTVSPRKNVGNKTKSPRPKQVEFQIFSDESVENAMASFQEVANVHQTDCPAKAAPVEPETNTTPRLSHTTPEREARASQISLQDHTLSSPLGLTVKFKARDEERTDHLPKVLCSPAAPKVCRPREEVRKEDEVQTVPASDEPDIPDIPAEPHVHFEKSVASTATVRGSEDLMVPDSEGESDSTGSPEDTPTKKSFKASCQHLDIHRFLFQARA